MTDVASRESSLERAYWRLVLAYPRAYRAARGAEIVGTLMDGAAPGQRYPRPGEVVDVLGAALRQRLGVAGSTGLAEALHGGNPRTGPRRDHRAPRRLLTIAPRGADAQCRGRWRRVLRGADRAGRIRPPLLVGPSTTRSRKLSIRPPQCGPDRSPALVLLAWR